MSTRPGAGRRRPQPFVSSQPRWRLFVAVEIPEGIREDIDAAASALQRQAPTQRWTDPAAWHLTLAFIGWVEPDQLGAVEAACESAAAEVEPFELRLDGSAGTFGGRVLWAGVGDSADLAELADRVRAELERRGFTLETRPFRAHLTLARARQGSQLPRGIAAEYRGPAASWRVERIVVMRSRLLRTGARYTVESAWRLAGA